MGVVYRALDRLTRKPVALKRVVIPTEFLDFMSRSNSDDFFLGLAQEFQVLSSLRHPHIISVYDYGFDENRQPFLVMELLENSQEITSAGAALALDGKVDLLIQTVEAVAYLHRRGIIHRDLKPSNVIVIQEPATAFSVKVLDFGLSIRRGQAGGAEGTLAYMAPEVLEGKPVTLAADLYAFGVLAYELLIGAQPFSGNSIDELIDAILTAPLNLEDAQLPTALVRILERLLMRNPEQRYAVIQDVLADLTRFAGRSPVETAAIRESFLQAADFVGREDEMSLLSHALTDALAQQGSAWLVGGESGVGKSRLLEEFRTRALVEGATVLRGQAVEESGQPLLLWRDVLRYLALITEITDLEAAILKPLVPDIAMLIEREVRDVPEIPGQAGLQRLTLTIVQLLQRQQKPLLLVLEDLHWANESLTLLQELCRVLSHIPVMVVGTYRSDESPLLAEQLPDMVLITLHRLEAEAIAELSVSMLGPAGEQPQVIDLLQRETEGNVFFLVEVVRALAEEAGSLASIGRHTLPAGVFTSGLQNIIMRRINRVSEPARDLLKLAALVGRGVDIFVLQKARPETDLGAWLMECSSAAILDIQDNAWRFAHDKFREILVNSLSDQEKQYLYRQSAAALEAIHGADVSRAGQIAYHWSAAGDLDRERRYSLIACDYYLRVNLFNEAKRFAERAYTLSKGVVSDDLYLESLSRLIRACWRSSEYQRVKPLLEEGIGLAQLLDRKDLLVDMTLINGELMKRLNRHQEGQQYLHDGLALARQGSDRSKEAHALLALINPLMDWDLHEARSIAQSALDIYRSIADELGEGHAIYRMAMTLLEPHELAERRRLFEEAGRIFRRHNARTFLAQVLMNLVNIDMLSSSYETARQFAEEGLRLASEAGSRSLAGYMLIYLSQPLGELGVYEQALAHVREALAVFRSTQEAAGTAFALSELGDLLRRVREVEAAETALRESCAICRQYELWELLIRSLTNLAMTLAEKQAFTEARQCFAEAADAARKWGLTSDKLYILRGIVHYYVRAGSFNEVVLYASFLAHLPHIDQLTLDAIQPLLRQAEQALHADEVQAAARRSAEMTLETLLSMIETTS